MTQSKQNDPIDAALHYQTYIKTYVDEREAAELAAQQEAEQAAEERSIAIQTDVARSSGSGSSELPALLSTIRSNESHGNYSAYSSDGCSDENGTFSCGGAYQLSEQYAAGWAAEAGYPGMSSQAQTWPATTQDKVAIYKFYASNPDGDLWCHWTTYC